MDLLDDVGEAAPAVHLQMALDVLTGAPIPRTLEEAEAMLDTKEARALFARLMGPQPAIKPARRRLWRSTAPRR
ncbi:hypothetical protein [Sphingobium sp.]|uniref:hypothetical protein n=1 Tax=Sphingobium sp. TaxID=1912891 RepID=UPI0028BE8F12|nr:hypothetical protein [Sphingobium sp.]